MRGWVLFLLVLTGCNGCAGKRMASQPEMPEPDMNGVLNVIGRWGIASACPISPHTAIMAAHTADIRPFDSEFPLMAYPWSDDYGHDGLMMPIRAARHMDIASYTSDVEFSSYYPLAQDPPQVGDMIFWTEYDFESQDSAFSRVRRKSRVIRVVARHIITREAPNPGASGGCALNSHGETVGIVAFGKSVGSGMGVFEKEVGGMPGVWGNLAYELLRAE